MNISELLSTGLAIISIATLAGLGLMRGTVTNLREQLKDTREANIELRAERAEDAAKIARLTTDLEALSRIVTGEIHWVQLGSLLDEHHKEARMHWEKAAERADHILTAVLKVAERIEGER